MSLVAGLSYFFTKTLIVFYLAPFLLLRNWRIAVLSVGSMLVYLVSVELCGISPFDLVFGRELGMGADVGEYVLDQVFSGNVWSILSRRLPPAATGAVCFFALASSGALFLPDMFRAAGNLREGMAVAVELIWVWFFVFNVFYTMNIITYVLPMTPFLLLFLKECRERRMLAIGGCGVLAAWYMLRALDVYVLPIWGHSEWGSISRLCARVLLVLLAAIGLWMGLTRSANRFVWLTRRLFPEDSV